MFNFFFSFNTSFLLLSALTLLHSTESTNLYADTGNEQNKDIIWMYFECSFFSVVKGYMHQRVAYSIAAGVSSQKSIMNFQVHNEFCNCFFCYTISFSCYSFFSLYFIFLFFVILMIFYLNNKQQLHFIYNQFICNLLYNSCQQPAAVVVLAPSVLGWWWRMSVINNSFAKAWIRMSNM